MNQVTLLWVMRMLIRTTCTTDAFQKASSKSAFHFARTTGPRPVGLTEKAWNDIFRSNQPKREEWLLLMSIPFPTPSLSVGQRTSLSKWNGKFCYGATAPTDQERSPLDWTETDLPIWLLTEIFIISGIIKSTQYNCCDHYRKIKRSLQLLDSMWSLWSSK